MKSYLFLLGMVVLALTLPALVSSFGKWEGFENSSFLGDFPNAVTDPGVLDSYPLKKAPQHVSDIDSEDVWWKYPIFQVGSYAQITNNMKYQVNPDIGRCTPIEFCDTIYSDKQIQSNVVLPNPPVPNCHGKRIGYFRSPLNLLTYENQDNILY